MRVRPKRFFWIPLAALLITGPAAAEAPTAAELFEQTLADAGLDAAVAALSAALADTTEPYAIDAYELGLGLPARLVVRHQREEALAVVQTIEPLFGDHPRYYQELGLAYLRCGRADDARNAMTRARDANDNRPDLVWIVENIETLAATARRQAMIEERYAPGENTGLDGPYLGQAPPGAVPEVFAPGLLSTTAHEYHLSFAPDGRTIIFSRGGVGTLITRWTDDGWTAPEVTYLIDADHLTEEANFTPDGQSVVFCGRPDVRDDRLLYRAPVTPNGWGSPEPLFPGMYATATGDGSLYYTAHGEGRDYGVIVRRQAVGSTFADPVPVAGEGINSPFADAHPWIAPDERLLLFDTYRDPGMGIYASFRAPDGGWSPAVSLHDKLGVPPVGQCALSHDGRYLFFCLAGDMYWVDAGFLDGLRPAQPGD